MLFQELADAIEILIAALSVLFVGDVDLLQRNQNDARHLDMVGQSVYALLLVFAVLSGKMFDVPASDLQIAHHCLASIKQVSGGS
jgi:hypothetical protein